MVSAYMGETPTSDNAVWLMGEQRPDGSRAPGIAQKSIQALREVGALDEIGQTEVGVYQKDFLTHFGKGQSQIDDNVGFANAPLAGGHCNDPKRRGT